MTVEQFEKAKDLIEWMKSNEKRIEEIQNIIQKKEEQYSRNGIDIDGWHEWITINGYSCRIDAKVALDILKSELNREIEELELTRRELFEL